MSQPETVQDTLVFERRFRVSRSRVFRAYADVDSRARWSAPSDTTALVYQAADSTREDLRLYPPSAWANAALPVPCDNRARLPVTGMRRVYWGGWCARTP